MSEKPGCRDPAYLFRKSFGFRHACNIRRGKPAARRLFMQVKEPGIYIGKHSVHINKDAFHNNYCELNGIKLKKAVALLPNDCELNYFYFLEHAIP
jgi:hypothetical protein